MTRLIILLTGLLGCSCATVSPYVRHDYERTGRSTDQPWQPRSANSQFTYVLGDMYFELGSIPEGAEILHAEMHFPRSSEDRPTESAGTPNETMFGDCMSISQAIFVEKIGHGSKGSNVAAGIGNFMALAAANNARNAQWDPNNPGGTGTAATMNVPSHIHHGYVTDDKQGLYLNRMIHMRYMNLFIAKMAVEELTPYWPDVQKDMLYLDLLRRHNVVVQGAAKTSADGIDAIEVTPYVQSASDSAARDLLLFCANQVTEHPTWWWASDSTTIEINKPRLVIEYRR